VADTGSSPSTSFERTTFGRRSTPCCRLIVVLNEKPPEVMGDDDVTQEQAFAHANDVLKSAVGGALAKRATSSTSRAQVRSRL